MTDNNGGDNMPVTLEKARLNVWNLGGFVIGIAVTAFGWGITYNSMSTAIDALKSQAARDAAISKDQSARTDARISSVEQKIPQFDVIALQIQRLTELSAQNAKAIEATNERLTRVVESQAGKLDAIMSNISTLTTEIRVVQSQLKDQERTQRTRLTNPVYKP